MRNVTSVENERLTRTEEEEAEWEGEMEDDKRCVIINSLILTL